MSSTSLRFALFGRKPLAAAAEEDVVLPELARSPSHQVNTDDLESKDVEKYPAPVANESERPSENAQDGVKAVEAITLSWSKGSLAAVYICMWLLYMTNAFQSSITGNLTAYVTSSFESHSLIPVIGIVSSTLSACVYLPLAKALDTFGRSEGFGAMLLLSTLGLVLMATCQNISTYCAAQAFYSIGFAGLIYTVDVVTADTSKLKNRGLAFAFTSSPYIISSMSGPKIAESFYEQISWRWAFGAFAIILPVVGAPLFSIMQFQQRKAIKNGILVKTSSGRTFLQSLKYYAIEFDAFCVLLFGAGLSLFLLPFSLADAAPEGWASGYIIAMLCVGFICLVAFGISEKYISSKPFMPFHLLTDRTLAGACLLCMTYQVSYYCWNSYFSSFLQVVNGLTIAQAGYVGGIFDIISGIYLLGLGLAIKKTARFRIYLYFAVPLFMLALGLMIRYRQPDVNIGIIILCQIFLAFSGATIILCEQVAVMAVVDHQFISVSLAMLGVSGWLGGSIGSAISGAIWTNTFPQALEKLLPAEALENFDSIYGDLTVQLSYDRGDPIREAIIQAYGIAQKRMLIAGVSVMALALVWVLLIKNIKLNTRDQTKGTLF